MKTPYVPHYFGDVVEQKLRSQRGWLTAGVASSIPWPKSDIWIVYNGDDFIIRGTERNGKASPPCINVPCPNDQVNESIRKVYRLTSILSWYKGGYVDVSGYISGSHPSLYGDPQKVFSNMGLYVDHYFNCYHLPIIDDENVRKALAFWREGCRLTRVHDSYAFLSFFKVIESQFNDGRQRKLWIEANIDHLDKRGTERVKTLRTEGIDVSTHLFESGRCAVAHASLNGEIVDPDIPEDRRRISADLDIMQALAHRYISHVLEVPNEKTLYESRNRLEPLANLLPPKLLTDLTQGNVPSGLEILNKEKVSVAILPDKPMQNLKGMTIQLMSTKDGIVWFNLTNLNKSIYLEFAFDFPNGRAHTLLETSGLTYLKNNVTEDDVVSFTTYFNNVLGNRIAELHFEGCEPIDCEVVIPVNMMPLSLDEALKINLDRHHRIINQT